MILFVSFLRRIANDNFVRHSMVFFTGSFVAAFFSYLYHPVLGRLLSLENFGEVEALLSISTQATVFLTVFANVVIHVVTHEENNEFAAAVIVGLRRVALVITAVVFVGFIVFGGRLQSSLQFESIWPFFVLAGVLLSSVSLIFRNAYLQGKHEFKALSVIGIIGAVGRLVFAAVLVYVGFGTVGAILGLLFSQLVAWWYVVRRTGGALASPAIQPPGVNERVRRELKFAVIIFFATLSVAVFSSADVVLAKLWFSPGEAGLYSGVSTIGRIIFFLTGSIAGVLFPMIKRTNTSAVNQRLLMKAILMTASAGGGALLVFFLAPNFFIRLLIGSRYLPLAHLLPLVGVMNFLLALVNIVIMYSLALRQYRMVPIAWGGLAVVGLLAVFRHTRVEDIALNFIVGCLVILAGAGTNKIIRFFRYHQAYEPA
ncbi:MAG: oligosaccharide flippase family protein [Candidatus Magasanikbacteria bacterium]|nr:oligosaccharide flippase family protein [Candidatus Magasanikbacteria bacterium]